MGDGRPSLWGINWTSDNNFWDHFERHGEEMGFDTPEQYSTAASQFANNSGKGIQEFKAKNGSVYKYDPKTNEFMIIDKNGKIVTYFEPDRGEQYFEDQFIDYGDYFIS
ncbi:MAG: hypothetical protein FWE84_01305 [Firmicutes bacterium]|nr:hypothetical protein [Bacillota bacterium]